MLLLFACSRSVILDKMYRNLHAIWVAQRAQTCGKAMKECCMQVLYHRHSAHAWFLMHLISITSDTSHFDTYEAMEKHRTSLGSCIAFICFKGRSDGPHLHAYDLASSKRADSNIC
jgi:hypothetical protein